MHRKANVEQGNETTLAHQVQFYKPKAMFAWPDR